MASLSRPRKCGEDVILATVFPTRDTHIRTDFGETPRGGLSISALRGYSLLAIADITCTDKYPLVRGKADIVSVCRLVRFPGCKKPAPSVGHRTDAERTFWQG